MGCSGLEQDIDHGGLAPEYLQAVELTLTNVSWKNNEISYLIDFAGIFVFDRACPVRPACENVRYGYLPRTGQRLLQPDQEIYPLQDR